MVEITVFSSWFFQRLATLLMTLHEACVTVFCPFFFGGYSLISKKRENVTTTDLLPFAPFVASIVKLQQMTSEA